MRYNERTERLLLTTSRLDFRFLTAVEAWVSHRRSGASVTGKSQNQTLKFPAEAVGQRKEARGALVVLSLKQDIGTNHG